MWTLTKLRRFCQNFLGYTLNSYQMFKYNIIIKNENSELIHGSSIENLEGLLIRLKTYRLHSCSRGRETSKRFPDQR